MSLANTKQSVGSLLLDFLKHYTEAACMRPEIYNTQGFVSGPALLELPSKGKMERLRHAPGYMHKSRQYLR